MKPTSNKPRIIIMRHSERLDVVLKSFNLSSDPFYNGAHPSYRNPMTNAHQNILDTPLTVYGHAHAFQTGEFFRSVGLVPHFVYVSPATRCVQTADSILDGLGVRDARPLKIDITLHEPTRKVLPLKTDRSLASEGFHIDLNYRPLSSSNSSRILLGETRLAYYNRLYFMLKRIVNTLLSQSVNATPKTVLIVTHKSCVTLLAALLNIDTIDDKLNYLYEIENSKRDEVKFLSTIIAEYDTSNGLWTFLSEFPQISKNFAESMS